MRTTKEDILGWLNRGKEQGATHLLVVCDTFSYEDYPVFVMPGEDAMKKSNEKNGPNMTRLMEVYKLADDWDEQLNLHRCFNY